MICILYRSNTDYKIYACAESVYNYISIYQLTGTLVLPLG